MCLYTGCLERCLNPVKNWELETFEWKMLRLKKPSSTSPSILRSKYISEPEFRLCSVILPNNLSQWTSKRFFDFYQVRSISPYMDMDMDTQENYHCFLFLGQLWILFSYENVRKKLSSETREKRKIDVALSVILVRLRFRAQNCSFFCLLITNLLQLGNKAAIEKERARL